MPQVQAFFTNDAQHERITAAKKKIEAEHGEDGGKARLMYLGALVVLGEYDAAKIEAETVAALDKAKK
jgi:hypothetical protein